jgi:hypothetical protein
MRNTLNFTYSADGNTASTTTNIATLTTNGNLTVMGSVTATNGFAWPTHGRASMAFATNGTMVAQALSTSWQKLTNYAAYTITSRNCGGSLASGEIVTTNAGTYQMNFGMSFTTASGTPAVEAAFYTNGVSAYYLFRADHSNVGEYKVARAQILVDLPANCTNSIYLKCASAVDLNAVAGSFNIIQQFN